MKVNKGVMTMMNRHKTVGNIYRLLDITVVSGAIFVESKLDSTILWNMHQGHMGEHDIQELHKRSFEGC